MFVISSRFYHYLAPGISPFLAYACVASRYLSSVGRAGTDSRGPGSPGAVAAGCYAYEVTTHGRGAGGTSGPPAPSTFVGVFAPGLLAVLGLVFFRRLGFVVGSTGLAQGLLMLALASAIALLTSLSLSAVATSRKVRAPGDGDGFFLSRALGVEFGGALGLALYLAQASSVAFYCIGFGEAAVGLFGGSGLAVRLAAVGTALAIFLLAYVGVRLGARVQLAVLAILAGALVSLLAGGRAAWDLSLLRQSWSAGDAALPFWTVFPILFPAVAGFTLGVGALGDPRNPVRGLPRGIFSALGVFVVIYGAGMLVLAASAPLANLAADREALPRIAAVPWLVHAAVLTATPAAALATLLGAARILGALAGDRLFAPLTFFGAGHGHGPAGHPRRAVVLTGLVALATIALGDLDAVAAAVSMFLLVSYGLLNYATYAEAAGSAQTLRAGFRFFHPRASLAGTGLCGLAMLMLDPVASLAAVGILALVHQYLHWTVVPARWRDRRRAYQFQRVKKALREIADQPEGAADWQPHILAFAETPARRERLLRAASWLCGGSGIVGAVQLLADEGDEPAGEPARRQAEEQLAADARRAGLDVHPLAVATGTGPETAAAVVQAWGVGPIRANTVMLDWDDSRDPQRPSELARGHALLLQRAAGLGRHAVVLRAAEAGWTRPEQPAAGGRRIDVWWLGDDSSRLALALARLATRTGARDEAAIRLLAPAPAAAAAQAQADLRRRLGELRIAATLVAVDAGEGDAAYARSRDATLVFLPVRVAGTRTLHAAGPVERLFAALPAALLVADAGAVAPGADGDPGASAPEREAGHRQEPAP